MKQELLVGSKVFHNGKWEYLMDPDDNYFLDEAEYHKQQLGSSSDEPPVYICYADKHVLSYTYEELLYICEENINLTDYLFENLMGEVPEDLLDEYKEEGRVIQCPHCNQFIINHEENDRWDY